MDPIKLEYIPQYTYEEYKTWEGKWELIYGVPYAMSPAPILKHQKIGNKIAQSILMKTFKSAKPALQPFPLIGK